MLNYFWYLYIPLEFGLEHVLKIDLFQVTPQSLKNLMQTESAHMLMPYWDRQMKRIDNPNDGFKFSALGEFHSKFYISESRANLEN